MYTFDSYCISTRFIGEDEMNNIEDVIEAIFIGVVVANFLLNTGCHVKAIELCKECLTLQNEKLKKGNRFVNVCIIGIYETLFNAYCVLPDYTNAIKYGRKILAIYHECGEKAKKGELTIILANIYKHLNKYVPARDHYEKAIDIMKETGDRLGEAYAYVQFGITSCNLSEYFKAREYFEKALAIRIEIGDRSGEASSYGNLGSVSQSLDEYEQAREYYEKALAIEIEVGSRQGEATVYGNLGTLFQSLGEYNKAREYHKKALAIRKEIGDRNGEAMDYGNLGTVFQLFSEYDKAVKYLEKALAIRIEIGDRKGEAGDYLNLGAVFQSRGEYDKAVKYFEKALAIRSEIGYRKGEAACYVNLGTLSVVLGEYNKAREYLEKALAITTEIGDRKGEAAVYGNLGTVFRSLGEYEKAREYHEKALSIRIKIGNKEGQAADFTNLGSVCEYLGEYDKAVKYLEKALAIRVEIGDRKGEIASYGKLGTVFQCLGEHVIAETYFEKARSINKDIGDLHSEFNLLSHLTLVKVFQGKVEEAFDYLHLCVNKSEDLRGCLKENDEFKISLLDVQHISYQTFSAFFCFSGYPDSALYVLELSRARALADLMATQYSVEIQISANSQSWIGIENIMKKEGNCACLYISYISQDVFLWILKASGVRCRRITVNESIGAGSVSSLSDFFDKSFRSFGVLPEQNCEDRSLNEIKEEIKSHQEESLTTLQRVEDDDEESQNAESGLSLCYRMLIAPVADLLEEPEIIIVPDRSLNQVPFAALTDESGKYLSENFRIRIVPSLTILKLIQDSPGDYHVQAGALIVGDPLVRRVLYKDRDVTLAPLPCARKEAEMIGELLGVEPLLGQCATKQAVLERLNYVSLVHFAAHGNAERGEIALSPVRSTNRIPHEEDYLLTMSDISQVRLRAKLVVLSCCHSGCGQIRAEGVIGIARAFLGSGARSVLVALWAIEDRATEQLMRHFYEHLIRGESASESLHETMKWMRDNGFTKVSEWAPFMLIGDNVTFDFVK